MRPSLETRKLTTVSCWFVSAEKAFFPVLGINRNEVDINVSVGLAGSCCDLVLFSNYFFLAIDELEFLHPSTEIGLRHVDIAFGIHCQSMAMCEITQLVPRTAET